ncbi:hypothetical protein [Sphingomonas sp. OTU376]|uniref:hypothetical protein n=1 Tax=Sphingomonas sp. OTU376 TaxID=3043863 RepID=UPI00313EA57B
MKLQHVLVAIPLLGVAAPALGQVTVRPQLQVTAQDLRQVSPLELRQRFPAQDQPVSRPYKLRPASSGSWLPKGGIKINQEALAVAQIAQKVKTQFAGKAVGWSVTVMGAAPPPPPPPPRGGRRPPPPPPPRTCMWIKPSLASIHRGFGLDAKGITQ